MPTNPTKPLDLTNIQGDIITQIPKKAQAFFFFQIKDAPSFRTALGSFIPSLATESSVVNGRKSIAQHKASNGAGLLDLRFTTISFTTKGFSALGVLDDIGEPAFTSGQLADAADLGDKGTTTNGVFEPDWLFPFKHDIHGVFSISGCSVQIAQLELASVLAHFGASIREVYRITGNVRPGDEAGHEHFGFLDGISNPAITGLTTGEKGDGFVDPGVLLLGEPGDSDSTRPVWARDASFMVFRQLNQLVPEFNKFLDDSVHTLNLKTADASTNPSDLLGARLIGRWKNGTPVAKSPNNDNPAIAADVTSRNDFQYDFTSPLECPFAAHTRKTFPRNDLTSNLEDFRRIVRRGIPFGPEVTASEKASQKTEHDRGLLFVSYQSSIQNGFQFIQHSWANKDNFPPFKPTTLPPPGLDPIIGQVNNQQQNVGPSQLSGTDPSNPQTELQLPQQWVVPKGGEYFITPTIFALKNIFSTTANLG